MAKKEQFLTLQPDSDTERDDNYETQKKVLAIKLRRLLVVIISLALICCVLLFITLAVNFVIDRYINEREKFSSHDLVYFIVFGRVSGILLLSALPLSLPIALVLIWCQRGKYTVRLQKFIQYQVTVNGVATFVIFLGAAVIEEEAIKFLQLLFINLIYGGLAAIALTIRTNPGDTSISSNNQPIVTRRLLLNIVGQAIYQAIVLFISIFYGPQLFGFEDGGWPALHSTPSVHFTFVFNAFVLMSIFNEINARKVFGGRNVFQNIHKDFLFIGIFLVELAIQVLTVQMGCKFLSTVPLSSLQWLWCIGFAAGGLLWQQAIVSIPCQE